MSKNLEIEKWSRIMELINGFNPSDDIPSREALELVSDVLLLLLMRARSDTHERIPMNSGIAFLEFEQDALGNPAQIRVGKGHKVSDLTKFESHLEDLLYRVHVILRSEGFGLYPIGDIDQEMKISKPEQVYLAGRSPSIVKAIRSQRQKGIRNVSDFLSAVLQRALDEDAKLPLRKLDRMTYATPDDGIAPDDDVFFAGHMISGADYHRKARRAYWRCRNRKKKKDKPSSPEKPKSSQVASSKPGLLGAGNPANARGRHSRNEETRS